MTTNSLQTLAALFISLSDAELREALEMGRKVQQQRFLLEVGDIQPPAEFEIKHKISGWDLDNCVRELHEKYFHEFTISQCLILVKHWKTKGLILP